MDPGQVVWLPGTGYNDGDMNAACEDAYGGGYYACDATNYEGGTLVYCCPY
jgi:hypothetical protein